MKLRVAAIVGVAAVAGIFVWQLASHPRVLLNAKVDFLVLTNTPTGVEAHMVMTNPPAASVTTTWFRYDTNGWRAMPGGIQWARHDSRGLVIAVGVSTTNQPLLFVHQFQERSTGLRRVVEQAREHLRRLDGAPGGCDKRTSVICGRGPATRTASRLPSA